MVLGVPILKHFRVVPLARLLSVQDVKIHIRSHLTLFTIILPSNIFKMLESGV